MTRSSRHRLNALVCVAVLAHGVYWLSTGGLEGATTARAGLAIAEVVVGIVGAAWFWNRARSVSL